MTSHNPNPSPLRFYQSYAVPATKFGTKKTQAEAETPTFRLENYHTTRDYLQTLVRAKTKNLVEQHKIGSYDEIAGLKAVIDDLASDSLYGMTLLSKADQTVLTNERIELREKPVISEHYLENNLRKQALPITLQEQFEAHETLNKNALNLALLMWVNREALAIKHIPGFTPSFFVKRNVVLGSNEEVRLEFDALNKIGFQNILTAQRMEAYMAEKEVNIRYAFDGIGKPSPTTLPKESLFFADVGESFSPPFSPK
jgi:hypothetical protein